MNKKYLPFLLVLIIMFTIACALAQPPLEPMYQTLTPMSGAVQETITARAGEGGGASDDLATAIVKATANAQHIYATQTARAELNEPARLATATAIAPIVAELPRYGVDIGQGYVAWIHNPATISLDGFQKTAFVNDYPQITAKDFVIASDITWNTKNSLSGCGFMFRADGDTNKPSQYVVIMTRTGNGHLAFLAMYKGEISNFHEYYPKDQDKSFNWLNDSTNRLAIVARGDLIDIYTNGVLIGQINITEAPPAAVIKFPKPEIPPGITPAEVQQYQDQIDQYEQSLQGISTQLSLAKLNFGKNKAFFYDGLLGFLGMSQSGSMTCKFENSWLFMIER